MKQLFKPVFALVALLSLKGQVTPDSNAVSASIDNRQAVKSLIESKLGDKIKVELSTEKEIQVATQVFGGAKGASGGGKS